MSTPSQNNNAFHIEFQSVSSETGHHISGNFRLDIPPAVSPDRREEQIEIVGQQFKRLTC